MTLYTVYTPRASLGARTLARGLNCPRVRDLAKLTRKPPEILINWGSSRVPWPGQILNRPEAIALAVSKRKSYAVWNRAGLDGALEPVLRGRPHNPREQYLKRRDGLSGGRGITLWRGEDLRPKEFLVPLFAKTHEFRYHIAFGQVIDMTQKKWDGVGERNGLVRSHDNGWVHAHKDIILTAEDNQRLGEAATKAVALLGLDFGAVDVMAKLNKKEPRQVQEFRIAEVNSAPGLQNTSTVAAYVNAFTQYGGFNDSSEVFG